METSLTVPKTVKYRFTTSRYMPKIMKTFVLKKCMVMYLAKLFLVAKMWKQLK